MQRAETKNRIKLAGDKPPVAASLHSSEISLLQRWLLGLKLFLAGLLRTLSRWKIAVRGWTKISFYSLDGAIYFARAFLRISRHLSLKELFYWTNCGIRLARGDFATSVDFFTAGVDLILNFSPGTRSSLILLLEAYSRKQSGKSLVESFHAAMRFAADAPDDEAAAKSLRLAARITRQSYYGSEILRLLEEIIGRLTEDNIFQRNLFIHVLDLSERMTPKFAVEFIKSAAPLVEKPASKGENAPGALFFERLMRHTEQFIESKDTGGALNFFLCGLEILKLGDAALIDKWAWLGGKINDCGKRAFTVFAASALDPTKSLVALALNRRNDGGQAAARLVITAFEATVLVAQRNLMAAENCYRTSPTLLETMPPEAFHSWVQRGTELFGGMDKLAAYFAAESRASRAAIKEADDALHLEDVSPVLAKYVEMLIGKNIPVVPRPLKYDALEPETANEIGLPPAVNGQTNAAERFRIYKTLAAQRAGQIEFGTFERGTAELKTLAARILKKYPRFPADSLSDDLDWRFLISLFPLTALARRLFVILENARIEFLLANKYRGLRRDMEFARAQRIKIRPQDQFLLEYEPLLEQLFTETLGAKINLNLEERKNESQTWIRKVREVLPISIYKSDASLADTISACLALYEFLAPEPPESSLPWEDSGKSPDFEQKEQPITKVEKGEDEKDEIEEQKNKLKDVENSGERNDSLIKSDELQSAEIFSGGSNTGDRSDADYSDESAAANVFYYDEWDQRINDYRAGWCRVVESDWEAGDLIFARQTRGEYRHTLSQIRQQFQLLRPVGLRKIRGQTDGEELDLDALTDFFIDKKSRHSPSDRIYSERRRSERDVAVCFLLDMSGSTNKRISKNKSILDVEKEALLLMSEALQAIGDLYAIYGFSSHSRRRVSFYRFKDFNESYGEIVERRIGAARCLVNTRLGAAVRHATYRLNRQPSATRLLIILTDAAPSDTDYNWQNAPADVRTSFEEARATGVTPFCIVFDQRNHSLETEKMLEGVGYAVIDNLLSLPERMPGIYRRLTT